MMKMGSTGLLSVKKQIVLLTRGTLLVRKNSTVPITVTYLTEQSIWWVYESHILLVILAISLEFLTVQIVYTFRYSKIVQFIFQNALSSKKKCLWCRSPVKTIISRSNHEDQHEYSNVIVVQSQNVFYILIIFE